MSDTIKRHLVGFGAALGVSVGTIIVGHLIGVSITFLAGWWGCMIFYKIARP